MPDGVPGVSDGVPDVLGQVRVGVFGVLAAPALPTYSACLALRSCSSLNRF